METTGVVRKRQFSLRYYDMVTGHIRLVATLFCEAQSPFFSKDGRSVCCQEGGILYSHCIADGKIARLAEPVSPEPSPQTVWQAPDSKGRPQLWRQGLGGTGQLRLTADPGWEAMSPSVSPDGKTVIYLARRSGESGYLWELRLLPTDGSLHPRRVARFAVNECSVSANGWSPDGRYFAFLSQEG